MAAEDAPVPVMRVDAALAEEAVKGGAMRVALAQASMAPTGSLARVGHTPLSSPLAGLKAVATAVSRKPPWPG